jgi:hypothetical protein
MKKWGRGIDFYFLITPKLKEEEKEKIFSELSEIIEFKENFYGNEVSIKDSDEENTEFIRMYSFRANFKLKEKDFNNKYSLIFYEIINKVILILEKFDYKMIGYDFRLVWLEPEPRNIIPMYNLEIPAELTEPFKQKIEENRQNLDS